MQNENIFNYFDETSNNKIMHPSVQQSLEEISAKEGYKSYTIYVRPISTKGGNYLGDLYEVDIKGVTNKGDKETNLFVKHAIKVKLENNMINANSLYKNEVFVYKELGNIFNNLQDEAGIPYSERLKMVKGFKESNEDAIFLENLSNQGYATRHRMDVMTFSFAEFSIKQIAKFHGLSFVLEQRNNNYYNNNIKTIRNPLQFSDTFKAFIERISGSVMQYFDINIQRKISNFIGTINEKLPKYILGGNGSVKCLCHGDFKINNILIKESGSKLADAILVDYQMIFFGSPVLDLIFFLYTGTDRKFRIDYMEILKDIYHDTLNEYLKYFEIDIDKFYSKKVFQEDFQRNFDFGLMTAFYMLPFCFTSEDEVPDFSKDNFGELDMKLDDRFISRFKGIVDDYLELGII